MAESNHTQPSTLPSGDVEHHLTYLKLSFMAQQYAALATQAAHKEWSHVDYLARLVEGEAHVRQDRATQSRIRLARFPVIKTVEQFRWDWPTQMNRLQVQHQFHLAFIKEKANLIFLGGVGLGKTHLATALGYAACLKGYSVLFASAIDVINTLAAAKSAGRLKQELSKYTKPALLILDELGYLPIDKAGADLLFQVISLRYEQGAIIITSNRAFKEWPKIFNNDSTLTAAILDRLLHHAETVVIEGRSFRMKDQLEQ
jgi:DNA replication protein DnaC